MNEKEWIAESTFPARRKKAIEEVFTQILSAGTIDPETFPVEKLDPLFDQFSEMIGIPIDIKPESKIQSIQFALNSLEVLKEAWTKISELHVEDKCQRIRIIGAAIIGYLANIPRYNLKADSNIFEILEDHYSSGLFVDYSGTYLSNTKIQSYRDSLYKLLDRVFSEKDTMTFYDQFVANEEFNSYLFFLRKREKDFRSYPLFLSGDFKRIQEKTIHKLVEIYFELCEMYKKLIVLVRALIDFIERKTVEVDSLFLKGSLGFHVKEIGNNTEFKILGDIDTVMRNAKAHESYVYDKRQREVLLKDRNKSEALKPIEILFKTRNLSALVLVIKNALSYAEYKKIEILRAKCDG